MFADRSGMVREGCLRQLQQVTVRPMPSQDNGTPSVFKVDPTSRVQTEEAQLGTDRQFVKEIFRCILTQRDLLDEEGDFEVDTQDSTTR